MKGTSISALEAFKCKDEIYPIEFLEFVLEITLAYTKDPLLLAFIPLSLDWNSFDLRFSKA